MDKLITGYTIEIATPECFPETEIFRTRLHLNNDIREVLPYLNAILENTEYYNDTAILLWENNGRRYAFRPLEIAIAPITDREEAQSLAEIIVGQVNDIWNLRDELKPDYEGKKALPSVIDIYKLLPRTNCKECDYATCMAFASALREGKAELAACTPLQQEIYSINKDHIERLFI